MIPRLTYQISTQVETITSGTRYAVPCFFTTCPVPDAAYDQMVQGKPKTNEDIADDWVSVLDFACLSGSLL